MNESVLVPATGLPLSNGAALDTQHAIRNTQHALPEWLGWQAAAGPDRLALVAPGVRWTFGDLDREATRLAGHLAALGVAPGDRVALLLGNSARLVALVHAAIRCGAVLIPLNVRLTAAELRWQLADCGARVLLHDAARAAVAEEASAELPGLMRLRAEGPATDSSPTLDAVRSTQYAADATRELDLDAVHCIIYTSGTTGRPKGALLTYGNHWWSAIGSALNLGLQASDRWLACLPLFHIGGLSMLCKSVIYGVPVVVHEAFDPQAVNAAIDAEGITQISVVSNMLQRMLNARGGTPYPPTLRTVLLGGGPAPRPLLEAAAAAGLPVIQTYGLTETASQVATLAAADALRKLGSAGRPLLPTQVRIVDADDAPLPDGTVSEIIVRGPTVTPGYLHEYRDNESKIGNPKSKIRDGWLHTGDLGYLDAEGYLYVVDRRDDLIISGGENVYPAEIEAVLLAHPAVAEAGVTGAPDARWGQVAHAFVCLRPGDQVSESDLIAFCAARLARYKVPAHIEFVTQLPRNAAGKLLRRNLTPQPPLPSGEGETGEVLSTQEVSR